MKKIKLLTGLSALSVVGLSVLPLTSCNKFNGKVTEDEWKSALSYLTSLNNEETYWSMSDENDSIGTYVDEECALYKNLNMNPDGLTLTYHDGLYADKTLTSKFVGDFEYQHTVDGDTGKVSYDIVSWSVYSTIACFLIGAYNYFYDFELKDDGYYHYTGEFEGYTSLDTKIKFSSDKKISHFDSSLITKKKQSTITIKANIHFNYSHKTIDYPQELSERVVTHYFKFNDSKDIQTHICGSESEGLILETTPTKTYTKFAAYENGSLVKMFSWTTLKIVRDGVETQEFTLSDDGTTITFNTPVEANTRISICFYALESEKDKTYTFKFVE